MNRYKVRASTLEFPRLSAFARAGQAGLQGLNCNNQPGLPPGLASSGLPNTFVPGRNLLFLTLAAALAYRRDLQVLITGICETDFSGYPDCLEDTMKAMQLALSLGMDKHFFD